MATEPFDDMPKITLEKDDLESFQRTRATGAKGSGDKNTPPDEPTPPSRGPSWFAFLFLLALVIGGAAYWSHMQYLVLQQAQSRITELENRLSATGEEMDQSAVALQVKVKELSAKTKELWEQMDKLWASAWRRNQADIKSLGKTVATVKANSDNATNALKSDVAATGTSVGLLEEQLGNQASLIKQLDAQLAQADSSNTDFEQQLGNLREKLISTALANNSLTNRLDDLDRRLKATEQKTSQPSSVVSTTP